MRFALIHRAFSDQGGTERVGLGLANHLLAAGHAVDLWCQRCDGAPEGARVRALGGGGRGRIWKMLSLWRVSQRIPRQEYDVVIGLGRTAGHDLYRAGGGCHRAWVARQGWSAADAVEVALDRRAVLGARRVVANSRLAAAELIRWYNLPTERLTVVHNGVNLTRFQPRAPSATPLPQPWLAFLGHGYARKGLPTALRALARLPGIHLAIWGAERRPGPYQALARRLGVADRTHFLGALAQPEQILPGATALLLPTRYDPFANVVLEALACGVPAITTADNGAAEVLPEPWMIVADPDDDAAFAAGVERVLQTPGLRDVARAAAEAHPEAAAHAKLAELAMELVR